MTNLELISGGVVLLGTFFCLVGGIGVLRLPDVYCRMHAAGVTDTLGAGLVLVGLAIQAGFSLVTFKLLTVLVFWWLTSPAATHALGKAAYARGIRAKGPIVEGGSRAPD
jgi:multicomponent Na+:H+ antiporter subunit G